MPESQESAPLDVTQALRDAENALRDFIASTLSREHGAQWVDKCGVSSARVLQWRDRQAVDESRQKTGVVDERLLYYADFYDLPTILEKNWHLFTEALGDLKTCMVFLEELHRLRDPDAHRRELLPHQKHLALGISGEIRTRIVRYRSRNETSRDYYPRIESAADNLGNRWVPSFPPRQNTCVLTNMSLRPGDTIEFVVTARDPEDLPIAYSMSVGGLDAAWQSSPNLVLRLTEKHVCEVVRVFLRIRSPREFHAARSYDDEMFFQYSVLPPRRRNSHLDEPPKTL